MVNRPPVVVATDGAVSVSHTFGDGHYRATAEASRWQDPDGDPLAAGEITGSADCTSLAVKADGTTVISCLRTYTGTPGLAGFAGAHAVAVKLRDPWVQAATASSTAITIGNSPVSASDSTVAEPGSCTLDDCCAEAAGECLVGIDCEPTAVYPHPTIDDPDGDPVQVTWNGGDFAAGTSNCAPAACTTEVFLPAYLHCKGPVSGNSGSSSGTFSATDGLTTSATRTLTVTWSY